ncbi:MAG: VCBS repeat-containing protein, partial [Gammaproteobacteria bacterium]|nr:VCBS repeat-containing protein [Gammaproteobacteria bacterium]
MNKHNIKTPLLLLLLSLGLYACSSDDVGSKEDKTNPGVTLTSLNSGEEVIGTYNITWITTDPNPSSVDIYLSTDSGATYTTIVDINVPVHDTGSYSWDSNEVADCRQCRIRIVAHDVVGNESAPADSSQDFIVNNVPQVLGSAFYSDLHADGLRDGDTIRVPFDKEINILTSIASDIFELSVLGDSIGSFAEVFVSDTNQKELLIRMNDLGSSNFHLHVGGTFNVNKLGRTASSGLNLRRDISSGVIFSPDTGRTAAVAERGIDIDPTFADSGQTLDTNNTTLLALGDINGDGHLDFVEANYGEPNKVWTNNSGVFTDSTQTLGGNNLTTSIALGDINGDGDLDMITGNSAGQANRVWTNNGSGIFSDTGQTLGGNNTNSIALGDIDNDGDLDVIAGNV